MNAIVLNQAGGPKGLFIPESLVRESRRFLDLTGWAPVDPNAESTLNGWVANSYYLVPLRFSQLDGKPYAYQVPNEPYQMKWEFTLVALMREDFIVQIKYRGMNAIRAVRILTDISRNMPYKNLSFPWLEMFHREQYAGFDTRGAYQALHLGNVLASDLKIQAICEDAIMEIDESEVLKPQQLTRCSNDTCNLIMLESLAVMIQGKPFCLTCSTQRS